MSPRPFTHANLVVVAGALSSDPVTRVLPSGAAVTNLEVSCRVDGQPTSSVPVAVFDPGAAVQKLVEGDEVVVVGTVRRRWFRAGGSTQSRTEVVASTVTSARQHARWRSRIDAAVSQLGLPGT